MKLDRYGREHYKGYVIVRNPVLGICAHSKGGKKTAMLWGRTRKEIRKRIDSKA